MCKSRSSCWIVPRSVQPAFASVSFRDAQDLISFSHRRPTLLRPSGIHPGELHATEAAQSQWFVSRREEISRAHSHRLAKIPRTLTMANRTPNTPSRTPNRPTVGSRTAAEATAPLPEKTRERQRGRRVSCPRPDRGGTPTQRVTRRRKPPPGEKNTRPGPYPSTGLPGSVADPPSSALVGQVHRRPILIGPV